MNRIHSLTLAVCLALPLTGQAAGKPKEAINFYLSNGAQVLMKEVNSGRYHDGPEGFLMIMDSTGKTLMHGESSKFVGVNQANVKDASGKAFMKDILDSNGASKGKLNVLWNKNGTQVKRAITWELHDDIYFCWVTEEK